MGKEQAAAGTSQVPHLRGGVSMGEPKEQGGGRPGPKDPLQKLTEPDLPIKSMSDWKKQNRWSNYLEMAHGWGTAGDVTTKVAVTAGLEALGHFVEALEPIGWIHMGYEVIELIDYQFSREDDARKRQSNEFYFFMMEKFWMNEAAYPSTAIREAAFDSLVGGNVNHGIAPKLTEDAEGRTSQLLQAANGRVLENMESIEAARKQVEFWGPLSEQKHAELLERAAQHHKEADHYQLMDPARSAQEQRWAGWAEDAVKKGTSDEDAYVRQAQQVLDTYEADIKKVAELESNPVNWQLTDDQKGMLNNLTSSAPATSGPVSRP
jgi:hypothetical protein